MAKKICKECGEYFHPLGFARHRAMHSDNRQKSKKGGKTMKEEPKSMTTEEIVYTYGYCCRCSNSNDLITLREMRDKKWKRK